MSKISEALRGRKAFIPFVTCGDPDLATTAANVRALEQAGAALIELGIPFSDPTAEGPLIQGANIRALAGGVTTDQIFAFVKELRTDVKIPLVFMTYANVVFSYGIERFVQRCTEVGVEGIILPDVPFEEKDEFSSICRAHDVDFISLIAPTSEHRIAQIAADADGFVYVVSSLGVTGMRSEIQTDLAAMIAKIRANTSVPCAIGFGISTPAQAAKMSALADGVIVGSAITKIVEKYGKDSTPYVAAYAKDMIAAM